MFVGMELDHGNGWDWGDGLLAGCHAMESGREGGHRILAPMATTSDRKGFIKVHLSIANLDQLKMVHQML